MDETHEHEPASPCPDCNRMTYWCEDLGNYFHLVPVTCFLNTEVHP